MKNAGYNEGKCQSIKLAVFDGSCLCGLGRESDVISKTRISFDTAGYSFGHGSSPDFLSRKMRPFVSSEEGKEDFS